MPSRSASAGTLTHSSCSTSHSRPRRPTPRPLILLAQTRQAERDKLRDAAIQEHHDIQRERAFEDRQSEVLQRERALAEQHLTLLAQNTKLTEEIARLTAELHAAICTDQTGDAPEQINLTPR